MRLRDRSVVRFALVGLLNTFVDISIYTLLVHLSLPLIVANLISTSCGLCVSYILNRNFTFKSTGVNKKRELALFLGVTLIGLWIIQPIIIFIASSVFASLLVQLPSFLTTALPKCCAIGVALIWNYLLYKKVVFKKEPTS